MTFETMLLAALSTLPVYGEDVNVPQEKQEQLQMISESVARVSKGNRDWAALLVAVAYSESRLSLRIMRGDCHAHECDHGLAWSPWQIHKNKLNEDAWGSTELDVQTREASTMLKRAFYSCKRSNVPWLVGTINAFAGRRCDAEWPGLDARIAVFNRVRARL